MGRDQAEKHVEQIEVRKEQSGEVVFRDMLSSPISAILRADYRSSGHDQVIVCSENGEIRGYVPVEAPDPEKPDLNVQRETLEKLNQRKQVSPHLCTLFL